MKHEKIKLYRFNTQNVDNFIEYVIVYTVIAINFLSNRKSFTIRRHNFLRKITKPPYVFSCYSFYFFYKIALKDFIIDNFGVLCVELLCKHNHYMLRKFSYPYKKLNIILLLPLINFVVTVWMKNCF